MKKTTRVLMIDDDVFILSLQSRLLVMKGYEVYTHNSATNIFATIAKYEPNIILMDQQMPKVNGDEAVRLIKSNERTYAIPVILYSSVDNLMEVARDAGADAYFPKAGNIEDLINVIETLTAFVSEYVCL